MKQVIEVLEAERAELMERLAWLDVTIADFKERAKAPAVAAVPPAPTPKRSARRGTAVRASNRRHAARDLKPDPAERIIAFLHDHPHSTIGMVAKGLDANRSTVASQMMKLEKLGDIIKRAKGYSLPPSS